MLKEHPYITQDKKDGDQSARQYISNMQDGAVAGFKYFELQDLTQIAIEVRGNANGKMVISTDENFENVIGRIEIKNPGELWKKVSGNIEYKGTTALYFKYTGEGYLDFITFELA